MIKSWRTGLLAVACGLVVMAPALAQSGGQPDPAAGKKKFYTCTGCHGISGYSNAYPTYHVPRLGGQHATYIESALKAYRSEARKHPTMHAQASSLSDEDIANIAAYLSQKEPE